eukprot:5540379-Alexandrium_andersonii.AAC.1
MDTSEAATANPHEASRFHLVAAPGAPFGPGGSAYDRAVLHLGDSGSFAFSETGPAVSFVLRVSSNIFNDVIGPGSPSGNRMVELGKCGATWWGWIIALEQYANTHQSAMITDPDTNLRYFGSNVVVVIDDAMNSFINGTWAHWNPGNTPVRLTRQIVIENAPTHVGGAPLPRNTDENPWLPGWRSG